MQSKSHLPLAVLVALIGCRSEMKTTIPCEEDTGLSSHSNPDYQFQDRNFTNDPDGISLPFDLDSASFDVGSAPGGLFLDPELVIDDLEEARAAWSNTTGADLDLSVDDVYLSDGKVNANDGSPEGPGPLASQIFMQPRAKDGGAGDVDSIASSHLWAVSPPVATNCDIEFWQKRQDGSNYIYVAGGAPTSGGQIDVAWIMAHELGHCIGLGDQTAGSTALDVMFGTYTGGTNFTVLPDEDKEGARVLYCEE